MIIEIDADPLVYRAGFAAEKRCYLFIAVNEACNMHEAYFCPKDGASAMDQGKQWLCDNGLFLVEKEMRIEPMPVAHALQIVRTQISAIADAVRTEYGADNVVTNLVLSGPDNFREKIATIKPYKGNRDASLKPYHYQSIRDYMTGVLSAYVVHGREADDEVSIRASRRRSGAPRTNSDYVVASSDKDLDQIPGLHYNYVDKVHYHVEGDDALRYFWLQAIAGDATDNIQGVPGIGPAKADKFLTKLEAKGASQKEIWEAIVELYGDRAAALENARLVYLQQEPGELWMPPGEQRAYLKAGLDD